MQMELEGPNADLLNLQACTMLSLKNDIVKTCVFTLLLSILFSAEFCALRSTSKPAAALRLHGRRESFNRVAKINKYTLCTVRSSP